MSELSNDELQKLRASVDGLRLEVEGWRNHTGSTGYFLVTAVEDLLKAVDQLTAHINAHR